MTAVRVTRGATGRVETVVHHALLGGVIGGSLLLLAGVVLTVAGRGGVPTEVTLPAEALRRAGELYPDGFYSLGLLVLILTPFVRVVGSSIAFLWERDWAYVAVTLSVLAVMIVAIWVGSA